VPAYEPRQNERKKAQPEVSAEKQRLAASLFGGSAGGQRSTNGEPKAPKSTSNVRHSDKVMPPRAASSGIKATPAKPAPGPKPAPLMDLMDMGDSDPSSHVTSGTRPLYDPFKELEGLLDGPPSSTTAAATQGAPPKGNSIDLMSLYDSTPAAAPGLAGSSSDVMMSLGQANSSSSEAVNGFQMGLMDAGEVPGENPLLGIAGHVMPGPTVSQEKKGPSRQDSLLKDAATRQVGVTPTGANPALFQDLLG
jgi:AP-4 complex subunit epsilon-1